MILRTCPYALVGLRFLAQALMLVPFLVMSLFAPGVMPSRGADGAMQVVLCSPEGPVNVTIGADGQPVPAKEQPSDKRCDWAMNHADMALLDQTSALLPAHLPRPLLRADLWVDHHPAHDPRGLYARGPPLFL